MTEVELKFQVPAKARQAVEAAVARGASRRTRLQAIYYDTPDRRLAAASVALRLRKEGRVWVQTAKADAADAITRLEHNVPLAGALAAPAGTLPAADWQRHAGTPVGERLSSALAPREGESTPPPLAPQYRTDIWRRSRELRAPGGWVELAFDCGHLIADDRRLPVCELEIELLRGRPGAVIAVARHWVARHGLWLDVRSKAERGDCLARGVPRSAVVKAAPIALDRDATADAARRAVVANCLLQILPNASEVAREDAAGAAGESGCEDHVHQLRVGLRRLRSALRFFDGWTTPVDPARAEALTQLFRQLGVARDRDALAASLLPALRLAGAPMFELPPAPPGPTPSELLRRPEATLAWLDWIAFQHGDPLARPAKVDRDAVPAPEGVEVTQAVLAAVAPAADPGPSLAEAAAQRLARWHRRIVRAARRYDELTDAERHLLRKRVKRVRYATEFTAALYRRKAVARYLSLLAPLQDTLGRYNDLCVGLETYRAVVGDDARAWFAVGWLVARRDELQARSKKALARFAAGKPFWGDATRRARKRPGG